MASDLLRALKERTDDDLDGLTLTADGLSAVADIRFGEVTIDIDHDEEAGSVRVSVSVPPPAGAGSDFLVWALSVNAQYWDVKIGLGEDGELLVHADLDAEPDADITDLAADVVDRAESILELLDDDLTEWVLEHDLGTPAQRERWLSRRRDDAEE